MMLIDRLIDSDVEISCNRHGLFANFKGTITRQ